MKDKEESRKRLEEAKAHLEAMDTKVAKLYESLASLREHLQRAMIDLAYGMEDRE